MQLHAVCTGAFVRSLNPKVLGEEPRVSDAELDLPDHTTKGFSGAGHPNIRYLIRRKTPMSLRRCLPQGLWIVLLPTVGAMVYTS